MALVALGAGAIVGALGRRGWPYELVLSTAPQQGAACVAFALWMGLGHPLHALSALMFAALNLTTARELFARPTPPLAQRRMRIVWANVWEKPAAFARVMALAEREQADLVAIGEYPCALPQERRRALTGAFSFEAGAMADETINVALFARTPFTDLATIEIAARPQRRSLAITFDGLRVIAIHPLVPYTRAMNADRDAMLEAAFAHGEGAGRPGVLVGDFNTTSWSPALRAIAGRARRQVWGPRSTWITRWAVLGLPIDHAFAFAGARVAARVGPHNGSDHLPLIVDVALDG